jgi:hypothetical protein
MRFKWLFGAALALLGFLTVPASAETTITTYDGVYALHFVPDAATAQLGAKEFDENAIVEGDVITLEVCSPMGFAPTVSSIDVVGSTMSFTSSSVSRGTISAVFHFNGSGKLDGTGTWTREDGRVWKFSFTQTN